MIGRRILAVLVGVVLSACVVGCRSEDSGGPDSLLADVPMESYRYELLDTAFDAASTIPIDPHVKSRSLAQEGVVTTCLELKQPRRAMRYVERIADWRQGAAYADLAFYCARQEAVKEAQVCLEQAVQIAQDAQEWRKERIEAKIAITRAYMGQRQAGAASGQDVEVNAMLCPPDSFGDQMQALDALVAGKEFDAVRNALQAHAKLFNRFHVDSERRTRVEDAIRTAWSGVPAFVRIDLLAELAGSSLAHEDRPKALELIGEAEAMTEAANREPQFSIPVMARLAVLRFRAGDEERARAKVKDLLRLYAEKEVQIANIYRAGTLRSLAEACQAMRDTAAARDVYRRALEAGVENPNSRPRAEDLAATCCSMAVHAVDPGLEVWGRIRKICNGLGDPW